MRLLILADTHIPSRARDLPAQVWAEVERADVVIHAGDWVDVAVLDALAARANRLIGVYGNNDGPALQARLPAVATAELAGLRLAVVHETGSATGRERRCERRFPAADVLVFGHSHIPWDTTTPSGLRLLNPGSPTDRRRQPASTYLTARVVLPSRRPQSERTAGAQRRGRRGHSPLAEVALHPVTDPPSG